MEQGIYWYYFAITLIAVIIMGTAAMGNKMNVGGWALLFIFAVVTSWGVYVADHRSLSDTARYWIRILYTLSMILLVAQSFIKNPVAAVSIIAIWVVVNWALLYFIAQANAGAFWLMSPYILLSLAIGFYLIFRASRAGGLSAGNVLGF